MGSHLCLTYLFNVRYPEQHAQDCLLFPFIIATQSVWWSIKHVLGSQNPTPFEKLQKATMFNLNIIHCSGQLEMSHFTNHNNFMEEVPHPFKDCNWLTGKVNIFFLLHVLLRCFLTKVCSLSVVYSKEGRQLHSAIFFRPNIEFLPKLCYPCFNDTLYKQYLVLFIKPLGV